MSDLNIALVLRFIDQATAPARKAMEGIQGASEAVQRYGDRTVARGQAMQETARQQTTAMRGATLATVGMGFAFYKAMQPAIDFEAQMSKVGAIANATDEQQRALARTALEQGARTRFSATEAAGGLEKLAAAGLEVEESIEGLPGVLDLAAASGVNLRDTADFVTNITSGFGLQVADMARVGDVLVNTFTSSNTTLESVAATMSYAATAARNLGVEIEQVAAMTGLLGDQSISGERAGTALRGIMARLSGPSTAASKALEQMNVQLADADGNLRALPDIFVDMNTAMADMGSATRGDLMNTIFGMQAANEAAILIDAAGTGALQNYTEQLRETGTASSVAARMSDNARGAIDRLKSVTEAAQIALGNGLLPVLVELAEKAMPFIAMAGEWLTANQDLVTTIGAVVAGLLLLNITMLAAKWGFWLLFGWVGSLVVAFGRFFQALGLLGRALAFIGGWAIAAFKIALLAVGNVLIFLARMAVLALWGLRALGGYLLALAGRAALAALAGLRALGGALLWLGRALAVAGRALLANPIFLAIAAIAGAVYVIYQNWDGIVAYFTEKFEQVKDAFQSGFLDGLAKLISEFNLLTLFMDMVEGVLRYLGSAFDIDLFTQGANMIASLRQGIWSVLTGMVDSVRQALASMVPSWLIDAWNWVRGGGAGNDGAGGGVAGARALGGPVRPGFVYEINEQGREFFMPDVPGRVLPANMFAQMAGGAMQLMENLPDIPGPFSDANQAGKGAGLLSGFAPRDARAQVTYQGDTINLTVYATDARDLERQMERFFERRERQRRYNLHDGGMHD